jgi:hypothetical protein
VEPTYDKEIKKLFAFFYSSYLIKNFNDNSKEREIYNGLFYRKKTFGNPPNTKFFYHFRVDGPQYYYMLNNIGTYGIF